MVFRDSVFQLLTFGKLWTFGPRSFINSHPERSEGSRLQASVTEETEQGKVLNPPDGGSG